MAERAATRLTSNSVYSRNPNQLNTHNQDKEKEQHTSTISLGSPFSANELHLARPGRRPASRIRTSSSGVILFSAVAVSTNTFFSNPSNNTCVALSKHVSKTEAKSGEEMIPRVSSMRVVNPRSCMYVGGRKSDG